MSGDDPRAEAYLDVLFASDRERRLAMARIAVDDGTVARACWTCDHEQRLDRYAAERRAFVEACDDLIAALPDLSDATRPGVTAAIRRLAATVNHYPELR